MATTLIRTLFDAPMTPEQGHPQDDFMSPNHGFLPEHPPLNALPVSHQEWDQIAAALPRLFAENQVITTIQSMSLLSGAVPEGYLCRASALLGILAHCYIRAWESQQQLCPHMPPPILPTQLEQPWQAIAKQLNRPGPGLAYRDLQLYNWQMRDQNQPRWLENLDLLIPAYGNAEERIFYLTMTEMHARAGTLLEAAAQIQEAVLAQASEAIKDALLLILDFLKEVTFESLLKIDPNPHSPTYADPLVWAKTVAPFAAPTRPGELGLSGGGSPIFHVLDALFERQRYDSQIGHELLALRDWMPPKHRTLFAILGQISLQDYMTQHPDSELTGLYQLTLEAYTGKRGWLGVHRLKVYGFMELGFKAGRTQTNGGFSGQVQQRAWEALDDSLEESRRERYGPKPMQCPFASRKGVLPTTAEQEGPVRQVQLDIQGEGLRYEVGDRLGILPRNSEALIAKTLDALQAKGDELLKLNSVWLDFFRHLFGTEPLPQVPLAEFLAYAKLRPLLRPVAKSLLKLGPTKSLKTVIESRQEDQHELWDALTMMGEARYDIKRLWKADPWQTENLSRLVPPESYRVYSISSAAQDHSRKKSFDSLALTIGALAFKSMSGQPLPRRGTASHFLTSSHEEQRDMPIQIVRPSRFRLPVDPQRPVVMFAGGTGISPFRGFWQARCHLQQAGPTWLFMGTQSVSSFYYQDEIEPLAAAGRLQVRVAFSREDVRATVDSTQSKWQFIPGPRGYVDALMLEPDTAAGLWEMIRSLGEGGQEGYFYICGQTRFAHTVIQGLKQVMARFLPGATGPEDPQVLGLFRRLMAQGRFMQDIFTTFAPANAPGVLPYQVYENSDLVLHNQAEQGYWMVIQGQVYDVTEFAQLHPGGDRILYANAGLDATRSYEKAEHHLNSEVHALLDLYKIGRIRRLDFKDQWSIALVPAHLRQGIETAAIQNKGIMYLPLEEAFRSWVRYLFHLVEIENAMANNYSLQQAPLLAIEPPVAMNRLRAGLILESHQILTTTFLPMLLGDSLQRLWCLTLGLGAEDEPLNGLALALNASQQGDGQRTDKVALWAAQIAASNGATSALEWEEHAQQLTALAQADRAFLANFKALIRQGVMIFEAHESETPAHSQSLIVLLKQVPELLRSYGQQLVSTPP